MNKIMLILALTLNFASFNICSSEKIKFLFTEDESVKDATDDNSVFDNKMKSKELTSSKYWNTPLTRLDYILLQLQSDADKAIKELLKVYDDGTSKLGGKFKKIENEKKMQKLIGKYQDFSGDNIVYFDEKRGNILAGFTIRNLGEPIIPLKKSCEELIESIASGWYGMPRQKMTGYTYHNKFSLINRGNGYDNLTPHFKKIAKNIVYRLQLVSSVKDYKDTKWSTKTFSMMCWKFPNQNEIEYLKWSNKYSLDKK